MPITGPTTADLTAGPRFFHGRFEIYNLANVYIISVQRGDSFKLISIGTQTHEGISSIEISKGKLHLIPLSNEQWSTLYDMTADAHPDTNQSTIQEEADASFQERLTKAMGTAADLHAELLKLSLVLNAEEKVEI